MTKGKAVAYLLATAVLWSSAGVLIKSVGWNPAAISSSRGLVAAATLWILLPGGLRPRELGPAHWISGVSVALMSVCFTASTLMTTAACAITLLFSAPVWVAFLAPAFLRERTAPLDWAFVAAIFGGMLLFFAGGLSARSLAGAGLGALSGLLFAVQAVSLRKIKDRSPGASLILGNLLAFAVGALFWRPPWPDWGGVLAIFAMGAFQVGLSYYIFAVSIPYVTSLELVVITMIEPVLNGLLAFLILGEFPGRYALAGGVIVLSGVGSWSWLKSRRDAAAHTG
ncbi:MAG: DMT family transporter [Deltaproteobacteria bacterium]|jgi:drug/metabolite transporter (DMT)-like permease|nr:DMT family transporter [Deltaproteobacteria bacterium]